MKKFNFFETSPTNLNKFTHNNHNDYNTPYSKSNYFPFSSDKTQSSNGMSFFHKNQFQKRKLIVNKASNSGKDSHTKINENENESLLKKDLEPNLNNNEKNYYNPGPQYAAPIILKDFSVENENSKLNERERNRIYLERISRVRQEPKKLRPFSSSQYVSRPNNNVYLRFNYQKDIGDEYSRYRVLCKTNKLPVNQFSNCDPYYLKAKNGIIYNLMKKTLQYQQLRMFQPLPVVNGFAYEISERARRYRGKIETSNKKKYSRDSK